MGTSYILAAAKHPAGIVGTFFSCDGTPETVLSAYSTVSEYMAAINAGGYHKADGPFHVTCIQELENPTDLDQPEWIYLLDGDTIRVFDNGDGSVEEQDTSKVLVDDTASAAVSSVLSSAQLSHLVVTPQ